MNLRAAFSRCITGLSLISAAAPARAQCEPEWLPGGSLAGLSGHVHDTALWDPDGPGPADELLIVGGAFNVAGDVIVSNIATWDDASWAPMGDEPIGDVRSIAIFQDTPYAAAGEHLWRWDGSGWVAIARVLYINELAVYRGELFVGGSFYSIDGVVSPNLIRWDGVQWLAQPGSPNNVVSAMAIFHDELIIGGYFSTAGGSSSPGVAAWDGSSWIQFQGLNPWVYAIAEYNDELYVGGSFSTPTLKYLAKRVGTTWQQAGEPDGIIRSLHTHAGSLFAGGRFTTIGGTAASRIAAWNGAAWQPLGAGISPTPAITTPEVLTLTTLEGALIAGGEFTVAGDGPGRFIAAWNGAAWSPLGEETAPFTDGLSEVRAMHRRDGLVYTGGVSLTVNGQPAGGVVTWDNSAWAIPGGGVDGEVNAIIDHAGRLALAGKFTTAGGSTVNNIALWDGSAYSPLGDGLTVTIGVLALTHYAGELIAAGGFTAAGGVPARNIAAWNGAAWRPLGEGTNSTIRALAVFNGELYAGGDFTSAGPVGSAAFRIARWDGAVWRPVGDGGLNNGVYAMLVDGERLLIGGAFTATFDLDLVNYAVAWDGSSWARLPGLGGTCTTSSFCNSGIRALLMRDGLLTAVGEVGLAGATANAVVEWDGLAWSRLPGDISRDCDSRPVAERCHTDGMVNAVIDDGPGLIIGGQFTLIGDQPQYNWARYSVACRADLACDGLVDFADYLEFLNLYESLDPRADFNGDGAVDFADYLEFLNLYEAGC